MSSSLSTVVDFTEPLRFQITGARLSGSTSGHSTSSHASMFSTCTTPVTSCYAFSSGGQVRSQPHQSSAGRSTTCIRQSSGSNQHMQIQAPGRQQRLHRSRLRYAISTEVMIMLSPSTS
ncbi:unnamed protein product [Symbiodinium pilosum]|uniref:Uncharacterized protein n=1 Tax=Symbiodinium pilosum TaxID=2952 RepID=A0A812J169_SYMPI|nr:unnamed protein product [Symbiodinium pilosum]